MESPVSLQSVHNWAVCFLKARVSFQCAERPTMYRHGGPALCPRDHILSVGRKHTCCLPSREVHTGPNTRTQECLGVTLRPFNTGDPS